MKKISYILGSVLVLYLILQGFFAVGRFEISYRKLEHRVDMLTGFFQSQAIKQMQASQPLGGSIVMPPSLEKGTLPDPKLTPGATNPDISQANIDQNICNKSWSTKSIRPPSNYTTTLKKKQIVQYGYSDTNTASYEEDHLISLELGGNPTDPNNLWPEAYNVTYGARLKDKVENYLHGEVCAGNITLDVAQKQISTDWLSVYKQAFGK